MLERESGSIVNITSNSGLLGQAADQVAHYGGTKGYVASFSKGLAYEWGSKKVRINCIAPGWIIPRSLDDVGEGSNWKKYGADFFGPFPQPDSDRISRSCWRASGSHSRCTIATRTSCRVA